MTRQRNQRHSLMALKSWTTNGGSFKLFCMRTPSSTEPRGCFTGAWLTVKEKALLESWCSLAGLSHSEAVRTALRLLLDYHPRTLDRANG